MESTLFEFNYEEYDDYEENELVLERIRDYTDEELKDPLATSIHKWEYIEQEIQKQERERKTIVDLRGLNTCALCRVYYHQTACRQCPIFLHTGFTNCDSTPNELIELDDYKNNEELLDLVRQELELLRSLRKE